MIKLGVTLPQFTDDPGRFVEGALRAEAAGLDSVWVFDHLWPLGDRSRPILEAWTALGFLATSTKRVEIGTLVTRSTLRHPAVLAKMASSVGEVALGRLIVGLGSGDEKSRAENEAFGLPYYAGADRLNQLASTLEVVTSYSSEGAVGHTDGFVHIDGLPTSPQPDPAPVIWLGGWSSDLQRIAGEGADGWNGWGGSPERFARGARTVVDAAHGREVELSWSGQVLLAPTDAEAQERLGPRAAERYLVGGPQTVAEALAAYVRAGATHLVVALDDAGRRGGYELLAREVLPALREVETA